MLVLGGWVFLMSEVPLYRDRAIAVSFREFAEPHGPALPAGAGGMSATGDPLSPRGPSDSGKMPRKRAETTSPFSPRGETPQKTFWQPTRFHWISGSPTPPPSPETSPGKLGEKLSPWKRLMAGVRSPFSASPAESASDESPDKRPASSLDASPSTGAHLPASSPAHSPSSSPRLSGPESGADSISPFADADAAARAGGGAVGCAARGGGWNRGAAGGAGGRNGDDTDAPGQLQETTLTARVADILTAAVVLLLPVVAYFLAVFAQPLAIAWAPVSWALSLWHWALLRCLEAALAAASATFWIPRADDPPIRRIFPERGSQRLSKSEGLLGLSAVRQVPLFPHTKCFSSRFAKVNSPTNPPTYPSLLLM